MKLALPVALVLLMAGCLQANGPDAAPAAAERGTMEVLSGEEPVTGLHAAPDNRAWSLTTGAYFARLEFNQGVEVIDLTILQGDRVRRANFSVADRSVAIGFLNPGTEYQVSFAATVKSGVLQGTATFTTQPGPAIAEAPLVQPGSAISISDQSCTLGFILRDQLAERLYALTAGHCASAIGEWVDVLEHLRPGYNATGQRIGRIVAREGPEAGLGIDWALIELNPSIRDQVGGGVHHWTGPTAVFTGFPTADPTLCHIGWGVALSWEDSFRPRCGTFAGYINEADTRNSLAFYGAAAQGDSGSPLIDWSSGAAVGILHGSYPGYWATAMDLCAILVRAHLLGFDLALWTSSYEAQPKPAIVPNRAASPFPLHEPTTCPENVLQGYWP